MDRLACIDVPALALQTALRRRPAQEGPVVLLPDPRPSSRILNLNRAARLQGLRPGMRYSEALSLTADVTAETVSPAQLEASRREILGELENWSPRIDPSRFAPGTFWADPAGLAGLFGSEADWGRGVAEALGARGYRAVVVVGASRLGTFVLARSRRRSTVVHTAAAEQQALASAPLEVFPLGPQQKRRLARLGISTWGGLLALPTAELVRRLGRGFLQEIQALQETNSLPLQGENSPPALVRSLRLDPPQSDRAVLEAHLAGLLAELLADLRGRGRLAQELRLAFVLETGVCTMDRLRAAEPTASEARWNRLVGLRLEGSPPAAPVAEVKLGLTEVPLPRVSGDLFAPPVVRNLRQGAEALALLRARWGSLAVLRAEAADCHRPEAAHRWVEAEEVLPPRPTEPAVPFSTAVRRIFFLTEAAGPPPAGGRKAGPFRLHLLEGSRLTDREYWFLQTSRGELVWAGWDRRERLARWEGTVD